MIVKIFIERRPWNDNFAVYLTDRTQNGVRAIATKIEMETIKDGFIAEPSFYMSGVEGQELIDELWQAGFRPTEGTGSAGAMAATQRHLEDMRRLVFEK